MSILNTSVSGMSADQNWLSSISQNVANATTTGYKDHRHGIFDHGRPGRRRDHRGRRRADEHGLAITRSRAASCPRSTATNLAVQGSGFFVVSDSAGNLYLTRNGSFVPDSSGNLVNSSGYYLMADNIQNGQSVSSNSLSSLQKVNVESSGLTAAATTSGSLAVNLPSTATATTFAAPTSTTAATCTDQTSLVVYDNLGGRAHRQPLFHKHWRQIPGRSTPIEGTTKLATHRPARSIS